MPRYPSLNDDSRARARVGSAEAMKRGSPSHEGRDEGVRQFKSTLLQGGVLDVRDLKLGETAHSAGIFASRSHADPGRARDRGLYNGARHAYLSKRKMK